ncbi:MFS transporter [Saccharomonospora xinjiangensis]|uniref:Arabinose efflux permease family protein n=1 Tax=Saccharomonospora xinjiangensis XJ-54 TaxID=882086 RepID=I0V6J3_9PSEU|nr:MFS transporter [Saccharomonospora xinjiangensis]EID55746.1 arabinose efflux permease family protein [Saccharomonospora xinjiangensis XJ-54]
MPARHSIWLPTLFVGMLALGTDEFVIAGLLPSVADDLGVSAGTAGQLVTAFALAFALGAPVLAVLTDRLDRKRLLTSGLLVFVLANAAVALSDDFALTLGLRIVAGLAAAVVSPTCMAIAGTAAPEDRRGRYLAVVTAGLTVALFTGVPLGAFLGEALSWRATFVLIAAVAAIVLVLAHLFAPSVPGGEPSDLAARLAPIRNPRVLLLVAAMFFSGAGGLAFYNYLGAILDDRLGATPGEVAFALIVVGVIGVVAVFLGGSLSDRLGPRRASALVLGGHCLALGAVAIHLHSAGELGAATFALVAVWSVFAWGLSPVMQAAVLGASGSRPMAAMSLGISGLYGGSAVGAAVGGYLFDQHGPALIPVAGTAFLAVAVLSAVLGTRPARLTGDVAQGTEGTEGEEGAERPVNRHSRS